MVVGVIDAKREDEHLGLGTATIFNGALPPTTRRLSPPLPQKVFLLPPVAGTLRSRRLVAASGRHAVAARRGQRSPAASGRHAVAT